MKQTIKNIISATISMTMLVVVILILNRYTTLFKEDYSKYQDNPIYKSGYDVGYKKGVEVGEAKIDHIIYQDRILYQGKELPHCALAEYPQPCHTMGVNGKEAIYLDFPY